MEGQILQTVHCAFPYRQGFLRDFLSHMDSDPWDRWNASRSLIVRATSALRSRTVGLRFNCGSSVFLEAVSNEADIVECSRMLGSRPGLLFQEVSFQYVSHDSMFEKGACMEAWIDEGYGFNLSFFQGLKSTYEISGGGLFSLASFRQITKYEARLIASMGDDHIVNLAIEWDPSTARDQSVQRVLDFCKQYERILVPSP